MRKLSLSIVSLLLVSAAVAGCSEVNAGVQDQETAISSSDVSGETTVDITDKATANIGNGPSYDPLTVDFDTADRERIFPNVVGYAEDIFVPENNQYTYAFIDINGNVVCDAVFDKVIYVDSADSYIVRGTQDGVSKYGIITADGSKFTGLIYDGLDSMDSTSGKIGFHGTNYTDGVLWITDIDIDLNQSEPVPVIIDQDELGVDPLSSQLSVSYYDDSSAVVFNQSEFYYNIWLVDSSNGKVLYKNNLLGIPGCKLFGKVLIEQQASGRGIVVYDMKGNKIIDDQDAYSGRLCEDRYMVSINGEISVYDTEWNVVNTLSVSDTSEVMTSFERIVVSSANKTVVYDKALEIINTLDYSVCGGTYFRDWYGFGEGDFFYDSISGTREVINVSTGAVLKKDDGFFYSFEYGYIVSDNKSNGNDPVKRWNIYDTGMNLISSGEGTIRLISDESTGDVYAVVTKDKSMTVYSMSDFEEMFVIDDIYSISVSDGRFYGWNENRFIFMDDEGRELYSNEIDHTEF